MSDEETTVEIETSTYEPVAKPKRSPRKLPDDECTRLAWEVLRGQHGVGEKRKQSLGKHYHQVIREVQRLRLLSAQR